MGYSSQFQRANRLHESIDDAHDRARLEDELTPYMQHWVE